MKYSKLPRIYTNASLNSNTTITVDAANSYYIKKVLRLRESEKLRFFNEVDGEFMCVVSAHTDLVQILIQEKLEKPMIGATNIVLMMSIVRPEKFEIACEMATQLGVSAIIPVITARSQKKSINYDRLKKIILESVRQSERIDIPRIELPILLSEINFSEYNKIFFANEDESNNNIDYSYSGKCAALIGPEGGFTQDEIRSVVSCSNVVSISLGPTILRSETAAVAMLSNIVALSY